MGPPGVPLDGTTRELGEGEGPRALVIALHGRGGTETRFLEHLTFPSRVRVRSVRGPIREGDGFAWFVFRFGFGRAVAQMRALLPRITATIEAERRPEERVVITGFSQGGMLAYAYAAAHPERVDGAVPISAALFEDFAPTAARARRMPRVRAVHGTDDEVIDVSEDRDTVARLSRLGVDASLEEVPLGTHWIGAAMRRAVREALREVLAEPGTGQGP